MGEVESFCSFCSCVNSAFGGFESSHMTLQDPRSLRPTKDILLDTLLPIWLKELGKNQEEGTSK